MSAINRRSFLAQSAALAGSGALAGFSSAAPALIHRTYPLPPTDPDPIDVTVWEDRMLYWGTIHGDWLVANQNIADLDSPLNQVYYDAAKVHYQIGDYRNEDEPWNTYADAAIHVYRDRYCNAQPTPGDLPGYMVFTEGLVLDWQKTGDVVSKNAAIAIANEGNYVDPQTGPGTGSLRWELLREVAYAIQIHAQVEVDLGEPHQTWLDTLFEYLVEDIYTALNVDPFPTSVSSAPPDDKVPSFMIGLVGTALINYWNKIDQDSRIPTVMQDLADQVWDQLWRDPFADAGGTPGPGFMYDERATYSARDIHLLVCPVYEWLYRNNGLTRNRTRGDQIFTTGLTAGGVYQGKQFNQSYRDSFAYVAMRNGV